MPRYCNPWWFVVVWFSSMLSLNIPILIPLTNTYLSIWGQHLRSWNQNNVRVCYINSVIQLYKECPLNYMSCNVQILRSTKNSSNAHCSKNAGGPPSVDARWSGRLLLGFARTVPQQQSQNTAWSHLQAALTLSLTLTDALFANSSCASSRRLLRAAQWRAVSPNCSTPQQQQSQNQQCVGVQQQLTLSLLFTFSGAYLHTNCTSATRPSLAAWTMPIALALRRCGLSSAASTPSTWHWDSSHIPSAVNCCFGVKIVSLNCSCSKGASDFLSP